MVTETNTAGADQRPAGASRTQTIVNWALALLTAVGAAALVVFAYGLALGTSGCSDQSCPHLGSADAVFGPVVYGAPVVSLIAIGASFVTARRRRGWVVPAIAWILLIIGAVLLAAFMR
ncbi:MAG: hypothetical protein QOI01_6164 [Mycobacterium sp.]|jgi:hypothetical protein|nr:hypothetical protein [Mycobacterium sp.]